MSKIGKKGISPVIATLLIVALAIILIAIILLWARTWIGEKIEKFNQDIESSCEEIEYEAIISSTPSGYLLTIENKGNFGIYAFELKGDWNGDLKTRAYNIGVQKGNSVRQEISLADFGESSEPDRLEIYPLLLGKIKGKSINKAYACLSKTRELSL